MNSLQPELIRRAVAKLPKGAKVILAMDHDDAGEVGRRYNGSYFHCDGRGSSYQRPDAQSKGEDWNDVLRSSNGKKGLSLNDRK